MTSLNRKISNLETRIAALKAKLANHGNTNDPLTLVKRLYLSHRTLNVLTIERRIVRTSGEWVFRENDGTARALSDAGAADFFRRMLALDRIIINDETAISVERIARGWFKEREGSE